MLQSSMHRHDCDGLGAARMSDCDAVNRVNCY
jgi:hypothetical protein